jgi:SAM-dependent methyltransferase
LKQRGSVGALTSIYRDERYLERNPTWHAEHSPWKADQIVRMLERNDLTPETVAEVGCGAGVVLTELERRLPDAKFAGYDISPQAITLAGSGTERVTFHLADMREEDVRVDLLLLIDVIEHVDDYRGFLRDLRAKAEHKILHIPLDLSVLSVARMWPILQTRANLGHVHYFSKELALAALAEAGYDVIDHFYTHYAVELPTTSWRAHVGRPLRRVMYMASEDLAVRLLGGSSLLVLAR